MTTTIILFLALCFSYYFILTLINDIGKVAKNKPTSYAVTGIALFTIIAWCVFYYLTH